MGINLHRLPSLDKRNISGICFNNTITIELAIKCYFEVELKSDSLVLDVQHQLWNLIYSPSFILV